MSDFGADTSDFRSDYANDFRPESNDYASDVHDFPGDFSGDFGGAPRTEKRPPDPPETAPPEHGTAADKAAGPQWRRQAGSASGKPRSMGQRHAKRP